AGFQATGRLGPARHGQAQALVVRAALVARRDVAREERVARAAPGDRLARLDPSAFDVRLAVDEHLREAAVGERHDRFARSHRDDLAHDLRALVLAGEL